VLSNDLLGGVPKETLDVPARARHAVLVEDEDDLTGVLQRDRGAESLHACLFSVLAPKLN
jgi:hypothetical protein